VKTSIVVLLAWVFVAQAAYQRKLHSQGSTFFDNFNFDTFNDPTHGFVNYVNRSYAEANKLIQYNGNSVYIGVDTTRIVPKGARGRDSVRVTSKTDWAYGLFIIDATHMPTGCGTWPAWWLVGPNWPNSGEIDIIEGVNTASVDSTTLHTSSGCSMDGEDPNSFTGKWGLDKNGKPATDCYISAPREYANQGCGIVGGAYGPAFNSGNGGVYALEWTPQFIQSFYFPRNSIPGDITSGKPNPSGWGKPYAYFGLGQNCPDVHFENLRIVLNTALCGDWAGAVFPQQCPGLGACNSYVQGNPKKFTDAYWSVNYIDVYQQ